MSPAVTAAPPAGRYRTIVADPPWPMKDTGPQTHAGTGCWRPADAGKSTRIPYRTMTLEEIAALPVADLAADDAHLYLWATNRFIEAAYATVRAWGFRPSTLLTWCKPPMGLGFGGAYANTTEFVLFAKRGRLAPRNRWHSTWLEASRPYENGGIAHSAKPEAFLDIVEQVSPGPYVELFARRARFGWDYWGDESLGTATMGEAAC